MRLDAAMHWPRLRVLLPWHPCDCVTRAASRRRMQHNQNAGSVEVQVFAKKLNTQPERVTVEIAPQHLKVEIRDEANQEVEYSFDEDLYAEVDAAASSHRILGTQVLIKMRKVDGAIAWPSLGKSDVPVRPCSTRPLRGINCRKQCLWVISACALALVVAI